MRLRYSPKPVVTAPYGLTLGGGCEIAMHGNSVRAAAETYMGQVEVGVGLIPAGGGTKEMTMRAMDAAAKVPDADPLAFLKKTFELLGMGKVATSAQEAKAWGFLREIRFDLDERRPPDRGCKTGSAESRRVRLCRAGPAEDILVMGESAQAAMKLALHMMKQGGFISDHDQLIGKKLANVMSGGIDESFDACVASNICSISNARRSFRSAASEKRRNGSRRC